MQKISSDLCIHAWIWAGWDRSGSVLAFPKGRGCGGVSWEDRSGGGGEGLLYNQSEMGSSQFAIPPELRGEWNELQRGNEYLIANSITHELFRLLSVAKRPGVGGRVYSQRSIYPIPHSPKIIMIDETVDSYCLLAQQPVSTLKYLLRKKALLIEVLQVVRELMGVAQQLSQKYGCFGISEGMIGVLRNGEVVLWVNESWHENEIQVVLRGTHQSQQQTMIHQLLSICQKHTVFDLTFLTKQYAGPLTFSQFSQHLAVKMEVEKFKLAQKGMQTERNVGAPTEGRGNGGKTLMRNYTLSQLKIVEPVFQVVEKKEPEVRRHRRNMTNHDKGSSMKSHSKSKGKEDPFSPQRTTSPKVSAFSHTNSIKLVRSLERCKHPAVGSQQQLRGTTGSVLDSKDISFSKALPHPTSRWTKRELCPPKPDNVITRSSQETNSDEFEEKEGRRESSIRWVEEDTEGCCKSIEEDYHCLFFKSPKSVFRKAALNCVEEEIMGAVDDE